MAGLALLQGSKQAKLGHSDLKATCERPNMILRAFPAMNGRRGGKMVGELLTWLGVGSVLLLAWTLYATAPKDEDEERAVRVLDD